MSTSPDTAAPLGHPRDDQRRRCASCWHFVEPFKGARVGRCKHPRHASDCDRASWCRDFVSREAP